MEYKGVIRHLTTDGRPAADVRTGYVPQQLEFDRSSPVTVTDFMAASLSRRPVFLGVSQKTREKVMAALARTHSERLCKRPLGALSGGELQRVLLALALTPQPDLLILDEPVSGVDQNGLESFYQTVDELKRTNHMAILLVSHDLDVVRRYADRVALMQGTIVRQGDPETVFDSEEFAQIAIVLLTPLFGMLGTMAVDNKMAFFSDALGHSALTGIAIGVVLGWQSQMSAMLLFGLIWAVLITFVKHHSKMSADTIISVFSSTSIALGLVVLSRGGAFAKYSSVLVGDVLSVAQGDLLALLLALVGTIACWVFLFNPLLITSVNAPLAQSRGIRSRMTEYAFTMLVAVAVMVSIRWVGVMLINSLLILPAAASRNVARSAAGYMRTSVIIALCCGVIGLALSYYLNTSAGAAIVLCCAAVYFVTLPMRRK